MRHEDLPKLGGKSMLELLLAQHLREKNCPAPDREFKFHPSRGWLLDFAWPEFMVAVEIEGGTADHGRRGRDGKIHKSRHLTPSGFEEDCRKYNAATFAGWRLYRFTGHQVTNGEAKDLILKVLGLAP